MSITVTISVEDNTTIRYTTKNVMIYEDKQKLIQLQYKYNNTIQIDQIHILLNLLSYYNDRLVIYTLNYLYITFFK
jgi:hypothetical protein